ncbi:MAG: aldo/keto reductase, partial [Candidatus Dormibacteraceae bacterium]
MFTIPTLRLQDGITIPQIGYGTWPISDPNAERVVATAIATGYRLIDTAAAYENEAGVGKGIRASGVSRKEIFLTTKLRDRDHGYKRTLEACKRSIQILDVDYLDLYLIHWPNPWKNHFVESWHALEDLQQEKLVRTIGVSNFKPAHIDRLISERETLPAVNQIQLEPRIGRVALREYNPRRGIVTQAWSPLGRAGDLLQEPTILSIAERHECTPAQV